MDFAELLPGTGQGVPQSCTGLKNYPVDAFCDIGHHGFIGGTINFLKTRLELHHCQAGWPTTDFREILAFLFSS